MDQFIFNFCNVDELAEVRTSAQGILEKMHSEMTVAEFFAGIGLMRLGLERAGWRVIWANDIDQGKKQMYDAHFGEKRSHLVLADVHQVDAAELPDFTLATASFPCTDLSLAGGRRGFDGLHSSAFWGFMRTINDLGHRRPQLILVENVPGFVTSKAGSDFRLALASLNELGYSVDAFVLNASHFVPQSRERLFVVCRLGGGGYLPPILKPSTIRPERLIGFIHDNPKIKWQICALPEPPQRTTALADILDDMPVESNLWWTAKRADYLLSQMSDRHRAVADLMINGTKWSYGTIFRRTRMGSSTAELRTDGVAGCLRTPKGGSAKQILFQAGFGQYSVRLLSGRECARLMGAGEFIMDVPLDQALFGFGDAVCVPVVEWIAQNYLNKICFKYPNDYF